MRTWMLDCRLCGAHRTGVPTAALWALSASHARTCPALPAGIPFRRGRLAGPGLRERLTLADGRVWLEIALEDGAPPRRGAIPKGPPSRGRAGAGPPPSPRQQTLPGHPVR